MTLILDKCQALKVDKCQALNEDKCQALNDRPESRQVFKLDCSKVLTSVN